jgi:hypothetical protein
VRKAVNSGVMTPNEGRHFMGLNRSDDPVADKLFANSASQPFGSPSERITLTGNAAGETPGSGSGSPRHLHRLRHMTIPPTSVPRLERVPLKHVAGDTRVRLVGVVPRRRSNGSR